MLVLYAISVVVLLWLYYEFNESNILSNFLAWNAIATGFSTAVLGSESTVQGNIVAVGSLSTVIVVECTSLPAIAIFLSGIIAFPASPIHKLIGALLGVVVLLGVNVLRTTSLVYIGLFFPSFLDVAHLFVWQSMMIVLVVVLWILWWTRAGSIAKVQA